MERNIVTPASRGTDFGMELEMDPEMDSERDAEMDAESVECAS